MGSNQTGDFNQSGNNNRQTIHTNRGNMVVNNVGGSVRQVSFGNVRTINVNGKDFEGSAVEQRNGRTFIDGKDVTDELGPVVELVIIVQGNAGNIEASGCGTITVAGDASAVKSSGGNIKVGGAVSGNVQSNGGNITCGTVGGSVKANGGNIHHIKSEAAQDNGSEGEKPGFFGRVFGQK